MAMDLLAELQARSDSQCELCAASENLHIFNVPPHTESNGKTSVLICHTCSKQLEGSDLLDVSHWHCLKKSAWSSVPAVQVLSWRILSQLQSEEWSQQLLDSLYLDEDTLSWARSTVRNDDELAPKHLDSNGSLLEAGDPVVLIKDLNVKGANFTAKRGTTVRNISLVLDNHEQIEGRVNGQQIVILTKFVKKA